MSDASTLCVACGRCCDGTLFDRVPLLPGEVVPLPVVTTAPGRGPHLRQPCAGLEHTACRCYAERPHACRQFSCLLLIALNADEVSLADALKVVDGARTVEPEKKSEYLRFHFGRH